MIGNIYLWTSQSVGERISEELHDSNNSLVCLLFPSTDPTAFFFIKDSKFQPFQLAIKTRQYNIFVPSCFLFHTSLLIRWQQKHSKNQSLHLVVLREKPRASNPSAHARRRAENVLFRSSLIFRRDNHFGCSGTDYNL